MKVFAIFLPMKDAKKSETYRSEHLAFLKKMRAEEKVLMNGRFPDGTGGLVIYKAPDYDTVQSYVKKDPYIIYGARDYDIREWDMVTDLPIK